MDNHRQNKHLMDGYIGIKFKAIQCTHEIPQDIANLYLSFKKVCERLKAYDMTHANAGNISVRCRNGFIISSSGSNLGGFEQNELVFVERCDVKTEEVFYCGTEKPSSEAIMHCLIYNQRPEALAIIHAHDEFATRPELFGGDIEESEREEPYGTIELAQMAIATFEKAERIIVLKNHGYVAIGPDLDKTCNLIIETHNCLLSKQTSNSGDTKYNSR